MDKSEKYFEINPKKFLFWAFVFILIYAISAHSPYYDTDIWARLIVGKAFWQGGLILKKDFLSYLPTDVWYDHEWGSSIIFYAFYKLFSFHGFILLQTFLLLLTFFFMQKALEARGNENFSLLFFIIAIFAFMDTNMLVVRCQLITFLFFTVFIYLFEKARCGNKKLLYLTPILMLIWSNMHGGCVSGIGLFCIYIFGEFLSKKEFKYFILPLILNLAVLPANPWGIGYLNFLLYANTLNRIWITEWYNLFDTTLFLRKYLIIKTFVIFSLFIEILYLIKASKRDWTKIVLTLTTIILGIKHLKHLPFAVITVFIFFHKEIYDFFKNLFDRIFNEKIYKYINTLILAASYLFILCSLYEYRFEPRASKFYPYKSVEFIKINKLKGNLLCDFSTGSFIGYKLYPQNKIFMDGRYEEVFSFENLRQLMFFLYAEEDYNTLLNKYPTDIILARNGYTVLNKLIETKKWTPIFYEKDFITLVRTENLKTEYLQPTADIKYYQKTLFDTDINFMIKSNGNERNK